MWFTSDNAAAAAPEVLAAVAAANEGYAHSYGADAASARVVARVREIFEAPEAAVYLVATGTAANALALACLCPPWATVYCHRNAHVAEDECGAPEFFSGGAKLTLIDGAHGRITPDGLRRALDATATVGVHNVQKGALSLTNATEAGTRLCAGGGGGAGGNGAGRGFAGAYGRGALRQCAGERRLHAGGADLEGRGGRAELRRHQERLLRGRGGGAVRSGAGLGVRAQAQARRASLLEVPLPRGADGGLSRGRSLAHARGVGKRPGLGVGARPRRGAGGAALA